jgi:hypothetical protein
MGGKNNHDMVLFRLQGVYTGEFRRRIRRRNALYFDDEATVLFDKRLAETLKALKNAGKA